MKQYLINEVNRQTRLTEAARNAMLSSADGRQEGIFGLHVSGMSVRAIASKLGCNPAVVQNAIAQARTSRPQIARRENQVAYVLHRAVATHLDERPNEVISKAMETLRTCVPRNVTHFRRDGFHCGNNFFRETWNG